MPWTGAAGHASGAGCALGGALLFGRRAGEVAARSLRWCCRAMPPAAGLGGTAGTALIRAWGAPCEFFGSPGPLLSLHTGNHVPVRHRCRPPQVNEQFDVSGACLCGHAALAVWHGCGLVWPGPVLLDAAQLHLQRPAHSSELCIVQGRHMYACKPTNGAAWQGSVGHSHRHSVAFTSQASTYTQTGLMENMRAACRRLRCRCWCAAAAAAT